MTQIQQMVSERGSGGRENGRVGEERKRKWSEGEKREGDDERESGKRRKDGRRGRGAEANYSCKEKVSPGIQHTVHAVVL